MADAVEHDLRHAALALIAFLARFIIDGGGKTVDRRTPPGDVRRVDRQDQRRRSLDWCRRKRKRGIFRARILGRQFLVELRLGNGRPRHGDGCSFGELAWSLAAMKQGPGGERERCNCCKDKQSRDQAITYQPAIGSSPDHIRSPFRHSRGSMTKPGPRPVAATDARPIVPC